MDQFSNGGRGWKPRPLLTVIHRYTGLAMAIFLVLAGVTGSIIAFDDELDAWLNPHLFRTDGTGEPLSAAALAAAVELAYPQVHVSSIPLKLGAGEAAKLGVRARIDPITGRPFSLGYDQIFADPITGKVIGTRSTRGCCNRENLIPFLYRFHYNLAMPGRWGMWLMGIVALLWTVDCFVGFYLTLPSRLQRWSTAWKIKRNASAIRLNVDLHRAGGLWLWLVLFALAVSSVYFNLQQEVFRPVVSWFSPITPSLFETRPVVPFDRARVSYDDALTVANREAQRLGIEEEPSEIARSGFGMYWITYSASPHDRGTWLGAPVLHVDSVTGELLQARQRGEGTAGDFFMDLQFPLHSGEIAGLPGRIVIAIAGLATAMLSVTGIVIWLKKRAARVRSAARSRPSARATDRSASHPAT